MNQYLGVVLAQYPNVFCWQHRHFNSIFRDLCLADGVHLNKLGQYFLYRSYRGASYIARFEHLRNRKRVACVYGVIIHAGNVRRIQEKRVTRGVADCFTRFSSILLTFSKCVITHKRTKRVFLFLL